MALPAFDTHAYVKKLKTLGIPESQAEGIVDFQNQVLSELVTEKLATREDLKHLEHKIKEELTRLKGNFTLLNWMIGFLLAGVVSILFKLFT